MKLLSTHFSLLGIALALSSCQPIDRGDPRAENIEIEDQLRAGEFARTLIDNTAFFRELPISGGDPDLLLERHTSVRVIQVGSKDSSFTKIELDSGAIGYVMTDLLEPAPKSRPDPAERVPHNPLMNPEPHDGRHIQPVPDARVDGTPPLPPVDQQQ